MMELKEKLEYLAKDLKEEISKLDKKNVEERITLF